jgi:hypothetical protein
MLAVKRNKNFIDKLLGENEYNFIILPYKNKVVSARYALYHISKFKNILNLKLKGNFFLFFFKNLDIYVIFDFLKKNNITYFFFCFNKFFINYLKLLDTKYMYCFYNLLLYFNYIYIFFNIISLVLYFLYDLIFFLKKILN